MPERKPSSAFTPGCIEEINQVAGLFDDTVTIKDLLFWSAPRIWKDQYRVSEIPTEWGQLMHNLPFSTKGNLTRGLTIILHEIEYPNVATLRDPDSLTMLTQATKEFILASFADRR